MTVTVYANNQSKHRILGVELELIKDTVFVASGGKTTFSAETIATITKAGSKSSNTEEHDFFEMVPFLIPSLTPTMKNCRSIKISYQIKFTLLIRGSVNFCVHLPITIGSIPSQVNTSRRPSRKGSISPSVTLMGFPSTSLEHSDGMTPYHGEAPPSYAESIRGQTRRYDAVYYNKGEELDPINSPQFSANAKKTS